MIKQSICAVFILVVLNSAAESADPKFRVELKVYDAQTGQPVKDVSVVPAPARGKTSPISWQRQYKRDLKASNFFSMDRGWDPTVLRVESPGYEPYVSEPLPRQTDHVLTIKLKKDKGISGRILSPDGTVVHGADIALCTWTREVNVTDGKIRYGRERDKLIQSDKNGQFELPSEIDPWVLVVAHKSGYAERTREQLAKQSDITLDKWGRIEGRAVLRNKPLANITIDMNAGRGDVQVVLHYSARCKTNANGEFSADQLPPVKLYVQPEFSIGKRTVRPLWFSGLMKIQPGVTTKLQIPRPGQTIRGAIALAENSKLNFKDLELNVTCFLRPPSVSGFRGSVDNAYEDYSAFTGSEFGAAYRPDKITVTPDGRFEIKGLPETSYVVQVRARKKGDPATARIKAFMAKRVSLPPQTEEEKVLDLGTLTLRDQ